MRRRWWIALGFASVVVLGGIGVAAYANWDRLLVWMQLEPAPTPLARVLRSSAPTPDELWLGAEGVDRFGYPTRRPSAYGVQRLLRSRRFDELTRFATQMNAEAVRDIRKEQWAADVFTAFSYPDPSFTPLLDAWVSQSPMSFAPYVARGSHRSALAWYYRGGELYEDVSRPRRRAFESTLELARADFERAITLNQDALVAYIALVSDGKAFGRGRAAFERAKARFPLSFAVYFQRAFDLTPRWGGSYRALEDLAKETAPLRAKNPKFVLLDAFTSYAKAQDLYTNKDYPGALVESDRSLVHGDHPVFLEQRGALKFRLADYAGALADQERGLAIDADDTDLLHDRARTLHRLRRFEAAGDSFLSRLRIASVAEPSDITTYANALVYAGHEHTRAGRPREALVAFDKALLLDPQHADASKARKALLARGDPNENEAEVTALVQRAQTDDDFEAYKALDDALAKRGRFAEVIVHWTSYLARHPNDGPALLERGGAYTRVKDGHAAMADAAAACGLGVAVACQHSERIKKQLAARAAASAR